VTGNSFWLLLPTVTAELMNIALEEFSKYVDPEKKKVLLLLIDGAGFHTGNEVKHPKNIQFFSLPPYTPELQPTETVWPLLREAVANDVYTDLNSFEAKLVDRCEWLREHPKVIKGEAGFRWILEIECTTD
jgi:transposase